MTNRKSKYTLRSDEVEEVLNTPPHSIINWGNTMILIIVVSAIAILSIIEINRTETMLGKLVSIEDCSGQLLLVVVENRPYTPEEIKGRRVELELYQHHQIFGKLVMTVDSSWVDRNRLYVILKSIESVNSERIYPPAGTFASLKLDMGRESFLSTVIDKI